MLGQGLMHADNNNNEADKEVNAARQPNNMSFKCSLKA